MQFDSILFPCVANSASSQMAEGLARQRFGDAEAWGSPQRSGRLRCCC